MTFLALSAVVAVAEAIVGSKFCVIDQEEEHFVRFYCLAARQAASTTHHPPPFSLNLLFLWLRAHTALLITPSLLSVFSCFDNLPYLLVEATNGQRTRQSKC